MSKWPGLFLLAVLLSACQANPIPTGTIPPLAASTPTVVFPTETATAIPPIAPLIAALKVESPVDSYDAIQQLVAIGAPAVVPLIAALTDPDPFIRAHSAMALGQIRDARAVDPLIAAMRDPDENVQQSAAAALAGIGAPAFDALIAALKNADPLIRAGAAEALGEQKGARAVDPLIAALPDPDAHVQEYAEGALVYIGAPAVEGLVAALQADDPVVRAAAADVLGQIGDTRAVEPLIAALQDEDAKTQNQAAWALGQIKDARAAEPLAANLANKNSAEMAANALEEIGAPAVEPLMAALKNEDPYARYLAAFTLGLLKDARAMPGLRDALQDQDSEVVEAAAVALGNIGIPAVDILISSMQDKNALVRAHVAAAMGSIQDDRVVEPLIEALKDPDFGVRTSAILALGNKNDPRVLTALFSTLQDKDPDIVRQAISALVKINDPQEIEPLIGALKNADWEARNDAEQALVKMGQAAVEPLITALNNEDGNTPQLAAKALLEIKDGRADDPLLAALQKGDLEVIAGAYQFFIQKGRDGSDVLLVTALEKYGTLQMAQDFLNCGNSLLSDAGKKWAESNGYRVITGPGSSGLTWGSNP